VAVSKVAIDSAAPKQVICIVGVGKGELLQDTELGFDEVQPGRLGRRPNRLNVELLQQGQKSRMVVNVVEVVQNDEELAMGVTPAELLERLADIDDALVLAEDPIDRVGVNIIEGQKLLGPFSAAVGGAHTHRTLLLGPSYTSDRLQLQGPPLVETHYR